MSATLSEAALRRVLLLRAYEQADPGNPWWTPADAAWATRVALDEAPRLPPADWLAARASLALRRLLPRDASAQRWVGTDGRGPGTPRWLLPGWGLALLAGLIADGLAGGQRIDLLAPATWGLIGWNLLVYGLLAVAALRRLAGAGSRQPGPLAGRLRRGLVRLAQPSAPGTPPTQAFAQDWLQRSAGLRLQRASAWLHATAALLALGLTAGLYLRGLVLDVRAGWQSTFLAADTVHAVLNVVLLPARWLTGLPMPDAAAIAAMQLTPGALPTAPAAAWIHLLAATVLLAVVLPRALLALLALLRAQFSARQLPLPLADPYFQRLLLARGSARSPVQVVAHGAPLSADAALALQVLLTAALGPQATLAMAATVAHGDEDQAAPPPAPDAPFRLVVVPMTTTPEAEAHGRLLQRLRHAGADGAAPPCVLLVDEAGWQRRFADLPKRRDERRAAWRQLADSAGVLLLHADLGSATAAAQAAPALAALLQRPVA